MYFLYLHREAKSWIVKKENVDPLVMEERKFSMDLDSRLYGFIEVDPN